MNGGDGGVPDPVQDAAALQDVAHGDVTQSRAAELLGRRVDKLIERLESELETVRVPVHPERRPATPARAERGRALVASGRERATAQVEKDLGTKIVLAKHDKNSEITAVDLEQVLLAIKHRPTDPAQVAEFIRRTSCAARGR